MEECRYCKFYVAGCCDCDLSDKYEDRAEPDESCDYFKEGNPYDKEDE